MIIVFLTMTAKVFKKERLKKNYSQSELAQELGVTVITVSRWEREAVPIPRMAELSLSALKRKSKRKGD